MTTRGKRALWAGTILASVGALIGTLATSWPVIAIGFALLLLGCGLVVGVGESNR